jgi:hypothetical protein
MIVISISFYLEGMQAAACGWLGVDVEQAVEVWRNLV